METQVFSITEIRYQLLLYYKEQKKEQIEWAASLFNALLNSQRHGISSNVIFRKSERPDFEIEFEGLEKRISFEVTMAASEAHQAAERLMGTDSDVTFLEPSSYARDPDLKAKSREIGIVRGDGHLRGPGWSGWEAENQWVAFIEQAINRKTLKYYEYGFDQLMIFDDSPVSGWTNNYIAVKQYHKNSKVFPEFQVNVLTGNNFIFDLCGKPRLYNIEKVYMPERYFPFIDMYHTDRPGKNIIQSCKDDC